MRITSIANIAAAVFSGVLLSFAFEPFNFWILGWIALVPFLWAALRARTIIGAAGLGFLFGLAHYATLIHWIVNVVNEYSALPAPVPFLLMLLLSAYLALFPAAFAAAVRMARGVSARAALLLSPVLWTAAELLRSFLLSGFPWDPLGNSQAYFLPVIQCADIGGVYLVGLVLIASNAALTALLIEKPARNFRYLFTPLAGAAAVVCALIYGLISLAAQPRDGKLFRVALVQDGLDNAERLRASQQELYNFYIDSTLEAVANGADVVLWGEGALLTLDMFGEGSRGIPGGMAEQYVLSLPRDNNFWLLMGSSDYVEGGDLYNVALTAGPGNNGAANGRYAKIHLTPFGEYVPFQFIFFWLEKIVPEISNFRAGERINTLPLLNGQVGVPICLEIIFPDLVRRFTSDGAGVLATISNDAWFGRGAAANRQHFAHAILRAVENRRYLLRCAVSGVSGVIEPSGRVQARSETYIRTVVEGSFAMREGLTFYAANGDLFGWTCIAIAIGSLLWLRYVRLRINRSGEQGKER